MLKRGVLIILAVLLAAATPIQAKPVASQPPLNSQRTEAQAKASEQNGAQDQPGSERAPIFIKLVAAQHDSRETEKEAQQRQRQAVTEQKLTDYTWYLFIATAALALVALAQAGLFVWQLLYMREGVKDARDNALATLEMAKLTRDEFNATHRPEIVIHSAIESTVVKRGNAQAIGASFTYFNKGTVAAKKVEICAGIRSVKYETELGERIVQPVIQQPDEPIIPGKPYVFNVYSGIEFERALERVVDAAGGMAAIAPEATVYCTGTIFYEDGGGVRRQTGFCWRWERHKWLRVTGNSYDYAY